MIDELVSLVNSVLFEPPFPPEGAADRARDRDFDHYVHAPEFLAEFFLFVARTPCSIRLRRNSIGVELIPEYYEMVKSQISPVELYLFEENAKYGNY